MKKKNEKKNEKEKKCVGGVGEDGVMRHREQEGFYGLDTAELLGGCWAFPLLVYNTAGWLYGCKVGNK